MQASWNVCPAPQSLSVCSVCPALTTVTIPTWPQAHGWLMAVAWGVLIPLGIVRLGACRCGSCQCCAAFPAHTWLVQLIHLDLPRTLLNARQVMARHGRWLLPGSARWFHLHRAIQVLGLACALSGFVVIF